MLPFLEHSPENCFVVEGPPLFSQFSETESAPSMSYCIAFGVSAPDSVSWARDRNLRYRESMRSKYPKFSPNPTGRSNDAVLTGVVTPSFGDPTYTENGNSKDNQPIESVEICSNPTQVDDRSSSAMSLTKSPMTAAELVRVRMDFISIIICLCYYE